MQKITFDTGIKTYQINDSGVLRFNPSDPNLFKLGMEQGYLVANLSRPDFCYLRMSTYCTQSRFLSTLAPSYRFN